MHGYHGNFLVALRALVYMMLLGKEGLDSLGSYAVLNARYLASKVSSSIPIAYEKPCMHEFVANVKELMKTKLKMNVNHIRIHIALNIHQRLP